MADAQPGSVPLSKVWLAAHPLSTSTLSGTIGVYDDDFPHRQNYRSGRRQMGYTQDNNPLRREAHDSDDWLGDEEEETKVHTGSCAQVHPTMSHGDWASSSEEEEERRQLRGDLIRNYERLLLSADPQRVRETTGWKWCSEHQRWTRS